MELFAKQQEGEDTEELQQRLDSLRIEARRLGIRGRGRGGFRGRGAPRGGSYFSSPRGGVVRGRGRGGRGFPMVSPGSNKLDRRPTSLMVTGFEAGEKEEIVKHFNKFGEVSDMVEDEVRKLRIKLNNCFIIALSGNSVLNLQVQDSSDGRVCHEHGQDVGGEAAGGELVHQDAPRQGGGGGG